MNYVDLNNLRTLNRVRFETWAWIMFGVVMLATRC